MQMFTFALVILPALAVADHAPAYGYAPAPAYCRETETSIYAEVCVPAFAPIVTPVTRAVKHVVDNDYCYNQIRTVCEETTKTIQKEICTNTYVKKAQTLPATTTQVTSDLKSETMKVTACHASGYNTGYNAGYAKDTLEHQLCQEEYQTQQYSVPLVSAPLVVSVEVAAPEPQVVCVTKSIDLTEVVCRDIEEKRCFNVAKHEEATQAAEEVSVVIGEPNCAQVTLTLPTKACPVPKPYAG